MQYSLRWGRGCRVGWTGSEAEGGKLRIKGECKLYMMRRLLEPERYHGRSTLSGFVGLDQSKRSLFMRLQFSKIHVLTSFYVEQFSWTRALFNFAFRISLCLLGIRLLSLFPVMSAQKRLFREWTVSRIDLRSLGIVSRSPAVTCNVFDGGHTTEVYCVANLCTVGDVGFA